MIAEPKLDEHGLQYYDHVPEEFRLATVKDLDNGMFQHNTAFLVHSYYTKVFYPHRVRYVFPESMVSFLKDGRIYIYQSPKEYGSQ